VLSRIKKLFILCFFSLILISGLFSQTALAKDPLIIYTALQEDEAELYVDQFTLQTGIETKVIRKSTGVLLNILQRKPSFRPEIDILLGGPAEAYFLAAKNKIFATYHTTTSRDIPDQYKSEVDNWWGIYLGALAISVNKDLLLEQGLKTPRSWTDLSKAEYQGLITIPNPVSSGTGYTFLSTIMQLAETNNNSSLLEAIDNNVKDYTRSGAMASKLTGLGYSTIGISFAQDIQKLKASGYPVALILPEEGTGYEIGGMAIIKTTHKLQKAEKFIDFMLEKGQKLYAEYNLYRTPTNINAPVPPRALQLQDIKLIDYNLEWSALNQQRLLKEWQANINSQEGLIADE